MLTLPYGNAGYLQTSCELLVPASKSIEVVWRGDLGESETADSYNRETRGPGGTADSVAAYTFVPRDDESRFYDLEVISRGRGFGQGHQLTARNWNDLYRFRQGKYVLIKRQFFREALRRNARPG